VNPFNVFKYKRTLVSSRTNASRFEFKSSQADAGIRHDYIKATAAVEPLKAQRRHKQIKWVFPHSCENNLKKNKTISLGKFPADVTTITSTASMPYLYMSLDAEYMILMRFLIPQQLPAIWCTSCAGKRAPYLHLHGAEITASLQAYKAHSELQPS
jgi:hypothetical protein